MSLQTWMDEFYPTPAQKFPTELEAVEHSLRKWKGLTQENLDKHAMRRFKWSIGESVEKSLIIDSTTCALCQQHYDAYSNIADCDKCVLKKVNVSVENGEQYSCDQCMPEDSESKYKIFLYEANPQPMIELLEKARAYLLCQQQNSQQNNS